MNKQKYLLIIILLFSLYKICSIDINKKLETLKKILVDKGVNIKWIDENISDNHFKLYYNINQYFTNMAEHRVSRNEKDLDWYKKHFGADQKVTACKNFIINNKGLLNDIESRHGIHAQLIVAILSMETNLGDTQFIGKFYVFSSLVSQFIFMDERKNFSIRELCSLYQFSTKIHKPVYYFIGSFAGACGLGQFIPSSLATTFIDKNNNDLDIDIYAVDDNLASIENYLYLHNLSGTNITDFTSLYKAIYSYNNSYAYAMTILYIYEKLLK